MDAFLRPYYQERIEKYLGKDLIIILTGQRRVGKSYVLRLFGESLLSDSHNNIIFIVNKVLKFLHFFHKELCGFERIYRFSS